ncbi:putative Histone H4 (putative) [Pseudozyma hubeiensis]|nr:putative Histone H4 (putative) [Pseudozyma hubeiensis]
MGGKTFTSGKCLPTQSNPRRTKRYLTSRSALERITTPSIRRLARRGGVKRIASSVYQESRFILRDFLTDVIRDAVVYSLLTMDVILSLKLRGRTLYHF